MQVSSWKKTKPCYGPKKLQTSDLTCNKWVTFELSTPIEWDGTSNLLLQYSHNGNTSSPDRGYAVAVNTGESTRSRYYCTDSGYSYPFNNSSDNSTNMVQILRLGFEGMGGDAAAPEGPKGVVSMLTSECGFNSKWLQTALQLTKLRLEIEAKEDADDDKKASEGKQPDGTTIDRPSASAAASSTKKQSKSASVPSEEAAAVVSTAFHRGDLVRIVIPSKDISVEERELRPGPLLSVEVGDVFEIDEVKTQASNKRYFRTQAFPALWLPTSCCTVLTEGDGFSEGDKVLVRGVGHATLQERVPAEGAWILSYATDSRKRHSVAVDKLLKPGEVREPRNFRVRGEMCKGGDSTFEVLAFEHVVIPELYIFCLYDSCRWQLVGVSLESIKARAWSPRVLACKVVDVRDTLRNTPMTAAVVSQMWDGKYKGYRAIKPSRTFTVKNVVLEDMDPATPEFPSKWIIVYDYVVLRKGADLNTDKVLDSENSSELKLNTIITVDKAETLPGSTCIRRMRVVEPVQGWITQSLNDDCKIVRRFTGVDTHPLHPHPLKLTTGEGWTCDVCRRRSCVARQIQRWRSTSSADWDVCGACMAKHAAKVNTICSGPSTVASGPLKVGETVKVSREHRIGELGEIVEEDKSDGTLRVKFADGELYWFESNVLRRPPAAGEDLSSTTLTVTNQSSEQSSHPARCVVDGDLTTYWESRGSKPHWFEMDVLMSNGSKLQTYIKSHGSYSPNSIVVKTQETEGDPWSTGSQMNLPQSPTTSDQWLTILEPVDTITKVRFEIHSNHQGGCDSKVTAMRVLLEDGAEDAATVGSTVEGNKAGIWGWKQCHTPCLTLSGANNSVANKHAETGGDFHSALGHGALPGSGVHTIKFNLDNYRNSNVGLVSPDFQMNLPPSKFSNMFSLVYWKGGTFIVKKGTSQITSTKIRTVEQGSVVKMVLDRTRKDKTSLKISVNGTVINSFPSLEDSVAMPVGTVLCPYVNLDYTGEKVRLTHLIPVSSQDLDSDALVGTSVGLELVFYS